MRLYFWLLLLASLTPFQPATGLPAKPSHSPNRSVPSQKIIAKTATKLTSDYSYWDTVKVFLGDSTKNTEPFTVNGRWSISWNTGDGDSDRGNFAIEIRRASDGAVIDTAANVVGKSKDKTQEYQSGSFYLSITATQKYTVLVEELYDPVKFAKENGPNTALHNGNVPIVEAAGVSEDVSVVRSLLDMGAIVDKRGRNGQTALMVASHAGSYEMVKLLLSKGADVNATDKQGVTPLMKAAEGLSANSVKVVQLLVSKAANINMSDENGQTALYQATFLNPHADIVKVLIDNGADVNKADKNGSVPLDWAIHSATRHKESLEVIKLLKAAGSKSNEKDDNGNHY